MAETSVNSNIVDYMTRKAFDPSKVPNRNRLDNGGGPPHDGDMEKRIEKLESLAEKTEKDLADIRLDLVKVNGKMEEFSRYYATKADVMEAKNSIIMWVVSAIFLAQLLPALLKKLGL